jgi:hypothetical protein
MQFYHRWEKANMTKITINVTGAGAETSLEEPGVTTTALDSAGRDAAGSLNAGSAPSLGEATATAPPVVAGVEDMGDTGTGQPIAAGPPPEGLFEMSGGDQ